MMKGNGKRAEHLTLDLLCADDIEHLSHGSPASSDVPAPRMF